MAPVRMSLAAAVLVALAIPAASAAAQQPTPTPTPTPAPERSEAEQDVYRDYRRDGVIEACDHRKRTLREVLEELPPEADVDNPDLRPALEAAIEQHDDGDCRGPEPTPTPEPTATPDATATPAPTTAPAPAPSPDDPVDSGSAAPPPATGGGSPPSSPPSAEDVEPLAPEITPVPPATTPAPAPAEPSGPAATPQPVYANADDELPPSLLVLAALLALVALLALLFAGLNRFGWAETRLARPRRALREAAFRIGGTWGDFADWLRLGR
jgi:hypothetical protein